MSAKQYKIPYIQATRCHHRDGGLPKHRDAPALWPIVPHKRAEHNVPIVAPFTTCSEKQFNATGLHWEPSGTVVRYKPFPPIRHPCRKNKRQRGNRKSGLMPLLDIMEASTKTQVSHHKS